MLSHVTMHVSLVSQSRETACSYDSLDTLYVCRLHETLNACVCVSVWFVPCLFICSQTHKAVLTVQISSWRVDLNCCSVCQSGLCVALSH